MNTFSKNIILDRDGVINEDPMGYISRPEDWHAITGSLEAIAQLNRAGWHVFVATNQSGIGRGFYDLEAMHAIHEKMINELAAVGGYIEEIFFCPHNPDENCDCRKPAPGLFVQLKEKYRIDLTSTIFIGDKLSDIDAARAVGCQPMLVATGYGQKTHQDYPDLNVPFFANLKAAVDYILSL
ncbi:MAG: D-glycero-beta-D-manno-heptose 1,7-bisphosphate 7-phosphatase [Gammaproteobacteria bacterium]|nr:D-glycero-beta-D-manno-heptose 1,7-bisphosphate 7-phosphatase [Gammaproteobacteria bacterium]